MLKNLYHKIKNFHFILLPVFFMLHVNNFYYGLIPGDIMVRHSFAYTALTISVFLFAQFYYRDLVKSCLFSFIALGYFFGFGSVKDFLAESHTLSRLSSYRLMLPLVFIMLLSLLIYLKKSSRSFNRLTTFLFIAISVNLIIELVFLTKNIVNKNDIKNDLGDPELTMVKNFTPCDTCVQPDVYFILFDEFTSSRCLKQYWNYSNDTLINYFRDNHFFVSEKSHSNYSFTTFSLPCTMEMQYLNLPPGYTEAGAIDLARGQYTLFNNAVVNIFEKQGYIFHNYSIFDMKNHPAYNGIYFDKLTDLFISDETLFGRTMRDIGWNLSNPFVRNQRKRDSLAHVETFNIRDPYVKKTLADAKDAVRAQDPAKKDFFYFHFMLPHDPFIYDSMGNPRSFGYMDIKLRYLDQAKYASKILIDLVNYIKANSKNKAVIILQGDHGFKSWPGEENFEEKAFENLNAVYLPDENYTNYYDGVSPVNTFRLLFNHYFHTNYDLLQDKSIQLFFKPDLKKIYGIRQKNS
ncbi:MAG: hypothetical protein EKK37_04995 [Sphingobacteriales bacterium]|nr:MAG: hypothetical protein EKK37_04995 [Sphingobacteriales bacterium]